MNACALEAVRLALANSQRRTYDGEQIAHVFPPGTYVFGTKFDDGDPGDAWCVGYYLESFTIDGRQRHRVVGSSGQYLYGPKGFIKIRAGLKPDVGHWLVANADALERSPPGTINLWLMLTDLAFGCEDGAAVGGARDWLWQGVVRKRMAMAAKRIRRSPCMRLAKRPTHPCRHWRRGIGARPSSPYSRGRSGRSLRADCRGNQTPQ